MKRRVRTVNTIIRRKKQRQKPDIRSFFSNADVCVTGKEGGREGGGLECREGVREGTRK